MNLLKTAALTLIIILSAFFANAQSIQITGKVIDAATLKPLANASVYIANTTIGTKTDDKGLYSFSKFPQGDHQVIVSCLGYKAKQADIVAGTDNQMVNISLTSFSIELKEVNINSKNDWKHNLALFEREFIGTSTTDECQILNQDELNLDFDYKINRLTASTDNFLDIQNNSLGYKLHFLIKNFWADYNTGKTHYSGNVIFEEMKGTEKQQKRWAKNRANAYKGSFRSFLISLSHGQLTKDKFVLRKLIKTVNPKWTADSLLREKEKQFVAQAANRGQIVHTTYFGQPKIIQSVEDKLLHEADIMKPLSLQAGIYKLQFPGSIYVVYINKRIDTDLDDIYRAPGTSNYQIAAITMMHPSQPILFNSDGQLLTSEGLFYEGAWNSRIVSLLPTNYVPPTK